MLKRPLHVVLLIALCGSQLAFQCKPTAATGPGEAVVFDIDGTLSNDPLDLLFVRDGAVEAVEAYLDLGYDVILLTARPEVLELPTRAWLDEHDFPDLPLYMPDSLLLFDSQKVEFKRDTLLALEATEDLDFVYAYGDSTTDFDAYAEAGIAATEVFALQRLTEHECQDGDWEECLPDYVDHLDYIDAQPPAP